jgi:hypothetical protein
MKKLNQSFLAILIIAGEKVLFSGKRNMLLFINHHANVITTKTFAPIFLKLRNVTVCLLLQDLP